jgi:CPA2 family monovalent cation:H+ antiporter-2
MLVDLGFIIEHALQVVLLVLVVLISNTLLNGLILHFLGYRWRESLYAGALLAQIGEFSFVLAAVGLSGGIISDVAYQYTIAMIALSLLVSPFWIRGARRVLMVSTLAMPFDARQPPPSSGRATSAGQENRH